MIKHDTEERTIIKKININDKYYCDVCNKIFFLRNYSSKNNVLHNNYYHVTTGHNDWGNDSIDSEKIFDVCSPECLNKLFDEYIKRSNNHNNTEYFMVDHRFY